MFSELGREPHSSLVSLAKVWSGLEGGQEGPLGSCSKFFHFGLLPKQQKAVQRLEMRQGYIQSVVALPHGLLYHFTEMHPPECGGVGSQWEEDIHYTGGMQNLRLGAFILPTTRNNKNTTILLLKPCNAGLKRKPQSCSCVHLGAISPVCTWAAGRELLARKEPSELLEFLWADTDLSGCKLHNHRWGHATGLWRSQICPGPASVIPALG